MERRSSCGSTGRSVVVESRGQCGRSFEVKNRPRANPVGGLGRGDRDAMAMLDARYWPRRSSACISLPNVDSVKILATDKSKVCQVNIDIVNIWKLRSDDQDKTSA